MRLSSLRFALFLPLACAIAAGAAEGQPLPGSSRIGQNDARLANLAANAGIGVAVAGLRQAVARRPVWRAVAQGAGGGLLMGAGKNLAGAGFTGSGFVGRQLHAIGIAMAAAPARDSLFVVFPIGPLHVGVHPGSADRIRTRVDVFDLVAPAVTMVNERQRFDTRASFSAGTPVFVREGTAMPRGHHAAGFALGSSVYITDLLWGEARRRLIAHETIHVLQWDAYRHLVAHPVERAALPRIIGGTEGFVRRADLGLLGVGSVAILAPRLSRSQQFWEREATLLAGQSGSIWF